MERKQLAGSERAQQRLLVLGAGPAQIGLLRAARERDLFVIAVDRDPSAPGFAYADKRALVSTEDEPAVDRLARAESVDGIISPGADWPVGVAARVAARLGLPHPIDEATAALVTTKSRQRERFAAAGVPQPRLLDEPVGALRRQGSRPPGPAGADVRAHRRGARARDRGGDRSLAERCVHRRGVRRRPGGDRPGRVDRRRLPPAARRRSPHRRPACVRGRAGARLALCFRNTKSDRGGSRRGRGARGPERADLHADPGRGGRIPRG